MLVEINIRMFGYQREWEAAKELMEDAGFTGYPDTAPVSKDGVFKYCVHMKNIRITEEEPEDEDRQIGKIHIL